MTAPKKLLASVLALSLLGACSVQDELNTKRGRGDSPVGAVDNEPKDVIQFPDRFSSVAHACDGHGHRVYVTTKSDSSRALFVVADPSCGKAS